MTGSHKWGIMKNMPFDAVWFDSDHGHIRDEGGLKYRFRVLNSHSSRGREAPLSINAVLWLCALQGVLTSP